MCNKQLKFVERFCAFLARTIVEKKMEMHRNRSELFFNIFMKIEITRNTFSYKGYTILS